MNEQNNNLNAGSQQPPTSTQPTTETQSTVSPIQETPVEPVATPETAVEAQPIQNPASVATTSEATTPEATIQPQQPVQQAQSIEPTPPIELTPANTNQVSNAEAAAGTLEQDTVVASQQVAEPVVEPVIKPAIEPTQPAQPVQNNQQTQNVQPTQVAQPIVTNQAQPVSDVAPQQPQAMNAQPNNVNDANQVAVDEFGNPTSAPLTPNASINANNINTTGYNGALDATSVGFVAADSSIPKKKNKGLIIGIVVAVLVVFALLGYFVIYPFIVKTYLSDPKNVYESTIKAAFKEVSNSANEVLKQKAIYDIQVSLDTNAETLKLFSGYTYSLNLGIDPTNKAIQYGYMIKDEATAGHSYYNYVKDGNNYIRYSTYRDLIYTGTADLESPAFFGITYQDLFDISTKTNNLDITYLINKVSDLVVAGIDETKLIKEDASITVDGKKLKVINNKYEFNDETVKKMRDSITQGLANDDKSLEILAELNDMTKDEVKDELTEANNDDDIDASANDAISTDEDAEEIVAEENVSLYTNIYTYGLKNDIVGFSITSSNSKDEVVYYFVEDYFEATVVNEEFDELANKDVIKTYQAIGRTQNGKTTVNIKSIDKDGSKDLAKLNVKSWEENLYEVDYETFDENTKVSGTFKLAKESSDGKLKYTFDISADDGVDHINVNIIVSEDWTSEVANVNTGTAQTLTPDELEERKNEFNTAFATTPIGMMFQTLGGFASSGIVDYYENETENYYESEITIN